MTALPVSYRLVLALLLSTTMLQGCMQPPPPEAPTSVETEEAFTFRPEPPPTFAYDDGVRIATLNTEFMFDGEGDEGQATFPHKGDPAKSRAHRDRIGEIVRMMNADVVMLEEVENERALNLLIEESLEGMGYTAHFVQGNDRFTGQNVALLSRLPIEATGRTDERAPVGASGDTYGVSKNMYARLMLDDVPTTLIGVHFLARPDDPSRKEKREAQAEVIRQLVESELAAGRAVAVLGDFNDFDESTLDIYGSRPITDVLARIKSAGPGDADDLRNVLADVPQIERFTAFYDRNRDDEVDPGELSALDHLLLSPVLYRHVQEVVFVHSYHPARYTDHFPVVVNLSLGSRSG